MIGAVGARSATDGAVRISLQDYCAVGSVLLCRVFGVVCHGSVVPLFTGALASLRLPSGTSLSVYSPHVSSLCDCGRRHSQTDTIRVYVVRTLRPRLPLGRFRM